MRTERPSCYLQAIFCLLLTQGLQRVAAHAAQGRRSLTYYPVLPNIRYETNPPILTNQLNGQLADPMEVASLFVEGLHGNSVKDLRYRIRKDSYTDASTGITHVYVTQIVGDLEVVDAVMNIHVRDGKVITFGDSFYAGLPAEEHAVPAYRLDSYSNYCRKVNAFAHSVTQQSVSAQTRGQSYHKDSNCDLFPYLNTFAPQFTESTSIADPRHAALLLSIIAHPRETQALQILNTYDAMFDALRMEVAGEGKYFLHGIPGTLDPVEAKLVYVQQPVVEPSIENEGATALTMGWRIVMDLQDNWYEAVVNARDPTHIISVVDWVSDAAVPERGSSHEDMHSRDQRPKHASRSWVDILRDPFDVNTWISSVKSLFKSSEGLPFIDILCIPNSPTYRVWRWGTNDPESGSRSSECSPRDTLTATNEIKAASPLGWHTIPNNKVPGSRSNATDPVKFTTTFGNNVFAQENWSGGFSFLNNFRPDAGAKMEFNWEYLSDTGEDEFGLVDATTTTAETSPDTTASSSKSSSQDSGTDTTPTSTDNSATETSTDSTSQTSISSSSSNSPETPTISKTSTSQNSPSSSPKPRPIRNPRRWVNVPVTQLFYTANMFHDLMYLYGFTEESGNFQQHNFGSEGRDNDAVITHVQDGTGFNWANFATPPDGQHGRLRYLWTAEGRPAGPWRDGALDNGMVIHELMHGVSNRMVGGSLDSSCLNTGESGGISEGTSDFVAILVRMLLPTDILVETFPFGAWSSNTTDGLRKFKYSGSIFNTTITYSSMNDGTYRTVQAIGSVWAEILFQILYQLTIISGQQGPIYPFMPSLFPFDPPVPVPGVKPTPSNQLMLKLIMRALKIMPCRPTFLQARDAIIKAAEEGPDIPGSPRLKCIVWSGFALRGLGLGAKVTGLDANGQGHRTDSYLPDPTCALG